MINQIVADVVHDACHAERYVAEASDGEGLHGDHCNWFGCGGSARGDECY